ncbi:hypothetical protein [Terrisporobacter sp.]|uniref:hypothetical protein n=1 Tax=Terrisporobacter sp. TaxID=1965305 RepID=UPI00289DBC1D|nr:hypothetical protein [Terrisporobacter sp.]
MKPEDRRKRRMIYKITDISNGKYYIGKEINRGILGIIDKFYSIHIEDSDKNKDGDGKLGTYIKQCNFNELEFEILEDCIKHIPMNEVLDKYLKDETNPNNMMYSVQQEYIKNKHR